jgi:hypothetical protein
MLELDLYGIPDYNTRIAFNKLITAPKTSLKTSNPVPKVLAGLKVVVVQSSKNLKVLESSSC